MKRRAILFAVVLALGFGGFGCTEPEPQALVPIKDSTWRSDFGWTITFNANKTWINSSGASGTWEDHGIYVTWTVTSTGKDHTTGVTWTGWYVDKNQISVEAQGATPQYFLHRI